ncbi:nucleotidyltransferase family protein [Desulfobacter sp.]|uniref:nucleotidyltransferase family protein n=1 Tax=Desulfobacter sp. TaxID=2294 RepID=UPI000E978876|nr:nucleotidyltransferase family protein [Desulfobacter sp.]HBT87884.1 alcohol dehydrogenase [Desulfobacter sp.]
MESWKSTIISPEKTIIDTIKVIESSNPVLTALVVDENQRLLGTVTDGDVRRGILNRIPMDAPVSKIMHTNPITFTQHAGPEKVNATLRKHPTCRAIPILDSDGRIVDLILKKNLFEDKILNPVFIMAGGLGTRLRPLTNDCPKPMLPVGNKPILEIILNNFIESGFSNFYISVNYKAKMIEEYFGDGSNKNVSITYLKEKKRLGTAGSLSLLESIPNEPVIVMNGDLLTKVNFSQLIDFHKSSGAMATLCVRKHDLQIPFGVAEVDNCRLTGLEEKPVNSMFINAGIYALNADAIKMIPPNEYYDMTDLFSKLLRQDKQPAVFPVREYWLDIGRISEYEKAGEVYPTLFES